MTSEPLDARVMVVDDDVDTAESMRSLLASSFPAATVKAYYDGEAALAAARRTVPDLLLTDLNMPKMNGLELLRQLAPVVGGSQVILMSAAADRELRYQVFEELGAGSVLGKPVDPTLLLAEVEERLRSRLDVVPQGVTRSDRPQRLARSATMRRYVA